jgi:hypothetical protein
MMWCLHERDELLTRDGGISISCCRIHASGTGPGWRGDGWEGRVPGKWRSEDRVTIEMVSLLNSCTLGCVRAVIFNFWCCSVVHILACYTGLLLHKGSLNCLRFSDQSTSSMNWIKLILRKPSKYYASIDTHQLPQGWRRWLRKWRGRSWTRVHVHLHTQHITCNLCSEQNWSNKACMSWSALCFQGNCVCSSCVQKWKQAFSFH